MYISVVMLITYMLESDSIKYFIHSFRCWISLSFSVNMASYLADVSSEVASYFF